MGTRPSQHWSVIVPAERYQSERLYQNDTIDVAVPNGASGGDRVLLVADVDEPVVFATAEVRDRDADPTAEGRGRDADRSAAGSGRADLAYTRRFFDRPVPAVGAIRRGGRLDADEYDRAVASAPAPGPQRSWLVSVDLPIEAESAADAVRQYWSYVRTLGPAELPTFVTPADDELAIQAYVFGEEANLDPEEDDD